MKTENKSEIENNCEAMTGFSAKKQSAEHKTTGEKIGFLFDLDGVLIDSENQYTQIWSMIGDTFPTGVENFALKIKGTTLENILNTYYPDKDMQKLVKAMLDQKEAEMVYDYTPGAEELLKALKKQGEHSAIVTSSNDEKMSILWRQHPEMKGYFDKTVDGDQVTKSKPDPEGYLLGAQHLGVRPERCAVFEDSIQGVKAGRAAGSYVIGVAGTNPAEKLTEYCDIVVESLEEIDLKELEKILRAR